MFLIDFHIDTLKRIYEQHFNGNTEANLWENKDRHVDLKRLLESNYAAQFFATFIKIGEPPLGNSHYEDALAIIDLFNSEIAKHSDVVAKATSYVDYKNNRANNKLSAFLTLEEGGILEDDITRLDTLYNKGVRAITLTWNYENCVSKCFL